MAHSLLPRLALIIVIIWAAVACDHSKPADDIKLPAAIQFFERLPFGTKQNQALRRASAPLWDELNQQDKDLTYFHYGVPLNFTREQALQQLGESLGEQWTQDHSLSIEGTWGWSLGFRHQKRVFVFITVNKDMIEVSSELNVIPAAIISNQALTKR